MTRKQMIQGGLACTVATLFCSFQFMLQSVPSFMMSELSKEFSLGLTQIGFLSSAYLYIYLCFQVPGGALADRCPPGKLLFGSCLLMTLAIFWFAHSGSYAETIVSRGLIGASTSPAIVVALCLAGRWFPERLFPILSGLVEAGAMFGGALPPLLIPDLLERFGWRGATLCLASAGGVLSLLIILLVRDNPDPRSSRAQMPELSRCHWLQMLRNRGFWLCCLYGFGMFAIISSFAGLWSVPFLQYRFPGENGLVRHAVSLIFIGLAAGAPLLGLLASITGNNLLIMRCSTVLLLMASGFAFFSGCGMQGMCGCCFLMGFVSGGYLLVFSEIRKEVPAFMSGVAMAVGNAFLLLGGPVLQPLLGWLLESKTGLQPDMTDYSRALTVFIGCQLVALVCIFLKKHKVA